MGGAKPAPVGAGFDSILATWVAIAAVTTLGAQAYLRADHSVVRPDWSALPNHGLDITDAHAVYLYSPGCSGCTEANDAYRQIVADVPALDIAAYDLSDPVGWAEAQRVQEELCRVHDVPPIVMADIPPALLTPTRWHVGDESVAKALSGLRDADPLTLPTFEGPVEEGDLDLALGSLTLVAVAGLADGLNPCALAGLAFLCAYLLSAGGSPRRALAGGMLFCLGTFAAYFAAGLGLYFAIASSAAIPAARFLLYSASAVCAMVFALRWWWDVGVGEKAGAVSADARRAEHSLVRRVAGSGVLWLGAPFLGAAFALLELACTGQVYLPAIAVLSSQGGLRQALTGLLVYNAGFVLPALALTVTIAATGKGLTATRFGPWARRGRTAVAVALTGLTAFLGWEVWRVAQGL